MIRKRKNDNKSKRVPLKATPRRVRPKRPRQSAPSKTPIWRITPEQQIVGAVFLGKVEDYYAKVGAVSLTLEAALSVGDMIRIKGHTTDLTQRVEHMEVDRQSVAGAAVGEGVGIKIADKVRIGDAVYKL